MLIRFHTKNNSGPIISAMAVEGHTAKWPAYVRFPIHNTL